MAEEVITPPVVDPVTPPVTPEVPDVEALVAERLQPIKGKLDALDAAKTAAEKRVKELETEKNNLKIAQLEAEGKKVEAYEARLKLAEEERDALLQRNTELTRDNVVTTVLAGHEFRNNKAMSMARNQFVETLKRTEDGSWVHESGASIGEAFAAFAADEENSFLFKPKPSQGGGSAPIQAKGAPSGGSLFQKSQADVLAGIKAGTVRRNRT